MAKTAMIRARTDEKLKEQVEHIFHRLGMTTTEAINLSYRQVRVHGDCPSRCVCPTPKPEGPSERRTGARTGRPSGIWMS